MDNKSSLKGVWSCHVISFKFWRPNHISGTTVNVELLTYVIIYQLCELSSVCCRFFKTWFHL